MTINFIESPLPDIDPDADGTFRSTLPVHFYLRKGSLTGPIVPGIDPKTFTVEGQWSDNPVGWPLIPGVNWNLNGNDPENDWYVFGPPVVEIAPNAKHVVVPTPDGGTTGLLMLLGIAGIAAVQRRSNR
jgi:hypothetical protein